MQKEENTALCFQSLKNGDGVRTLVARMPDYLPLVEWELHTLQDMKWNDNHQHPIKYWSRDNINSIRWLQWQPAYAQNSIYAPQCYINSDMPLKRLYTQMHTADWWWETQERRDSRG
jgi:hypothetical protein